MPKYFGDEKMKDHLYQKIPASNIFFQEQGLSVINAFAGVDSSIFHCRNPKTHAEMLFAAGLNKNSQLGLDKDKNLELMIRPVEIRLPEDSLVIYEIAGSENFHAIRTSKGVYALFQGVIF